MRTVCAPREVRQVELDLVPAVVQAHGHGADEGLHAGGGLRAWSTHGAHAHEGSHAGWRRAVLCRLWACTVARVTQAATFSAEGGAALAPGQSLGVKTDGRFSCKSGRRKRPVHQAAAAYTAGGSQAHLVVGGAEAPAHVLVVQNLHLEAEVLLQVLYYHNQERQLDAERLLRVRGAGHVRGAHVRGHYLKHAAGYVVVGDALDVAVADCGAHAARASAPRLVSAHCCNTPLSFRRAGQKFDQSRLLAAAQGAQVLAFCGPYLKRPAPERVED